MANPTEEFVALVQTSNRISIDKKISNLLKLKQGDLVRVRISLEKRK